MKRVTFFVLSIALIAGSNRAWSLSWQWNIAGAGVNASGTFTTDDRPDAQGFYRITTIAGNANGGTITALQPAGTAIPGNAGYPVDNLVSMNGAQLTTHGFGFAVSNGEYHNPFRTSGYLDYISTPPYADGAGKEPAIRFTATVAPKPAP
jgi:hypothetical protein